MKFDTSLGTLWLDANEHALTTVSYTKISESKTANPVILEQAKEEILQFLDGQLTAFTVPYEFIYGTSFQQEVWHALAQIPYGKTCCYQDIAEQIQRPKAVRAIGQANRKNPLPIIIPCHRVIGKGGQLTGYSGSSAEGLAIKQQLLTVEQNE
ncbi:methylated-DNA--[protein]-cysteine S-methyltransferase [Enterococcus sp. AZ072]|uniref:methylated-DNA--[protein]-cysteine S-methyltransferase n=1 Tax=unclassified Enterococcus TaxID=2608891 RepID=UPI003D2C772C